MKKKFYNSVEWGIQEKNINQIRNNGLEFLESIGCNTCKHYSLCIKDIIKNKRIMEEVFDGKTKYLVVFEPSDKKKSKIGKFNIGDKNEILEMIKDISPEEWENFRVSFVEQINPNQHSFSGVAISDGKGKLMIEFILGTTDSRELTSRGADPKKIESCYFCDFDTISKTPKTIPIQLVKQIKESCHFFKGYYEFVYGDSENDRDIFFTFYSDIDKYLNILNNTNDIVDIDEEVSARLKYNFTNNFQYSVGSRTNDGQIIEDER